MVIKYKIIYNINIKFGEEKYSIGIKFLTKVIVVTSVHMYGSQVSESQVSGSQKGGHKCPSHKCPGHKCPGHKCPGHKCPVTHRSSCVS